MKRAHHRVQETERFAVFSRKAWRNPADNPGLWNVRINRSEEAKDGWY